MQDCMTIISFIVPAHNEEILIGQALSALERAARASGEPFEIIVVDDASTDATASVAQEHGARVISVHHRHIAATRNAGARQARGEFLFFVDADTLATPEAVAAGIKALRSGAVGGGCVFNFDGALPLWARILHPIGVSVGRIIRLIGGCFLFCRSDVLRSIGGFSERVYAAEELFFIRALKQQGRFVVPPHFVITSGRKVRTHSLAEALSTLMGMWWGGAASMENREKLDLWYGQRRLDPLGREHQLKQ
jgi:glycosyltransferase involved in cell wall biosynthesis